MALSLPNLFRAVIVLALAVHVFVMYCTARTLEGEIGFQLSTSALAAGFALVMLLPFVWAIALPEMPEMYLRHVRSQRRFDRGRCPNCSYKPGQHHPPLCPECGNPVRRPDPYRVRSRTIQLFIAINLIAWVIGCVAAEAWVLHDERLFATELQMQQQSPAAQVSPYTRQRRWPNEALTLREPEVSAAGMKQDPSE